MAWRLTIGGVDQTAIVDSFTTTVALNDRARATVVVADVMPPRLAELVSYAADGITPLFGGVILQRSLQGRNQYDSTFQLTLEVGDWLTYADWCYTTRAYPEAVTLKQVLADLVADHLAQYGITLDPAQVAGPTIAAFTWTDKRVADALRELSDRTTYVVRIDPAKRLRMFVPATLPAPVAMTEATPHCHELTWGDSERTPYNKVLLRCGPNGAGDPVPFHWVGNAGHVYRLLGVAVPASSVFPGVVFVDGVQYPIWPPGAGPPDHIEWDAATDDGTLTFIGPFSEALDTVGADIGITYAPQFPFTVTKSTGATPVVEHLEDRPDVLALAVAEEIATTLLAQGQAAPREASILTDQDGFIPGQALTIALATTRSIAGTFLITSVGLTIVLDTAQGDRHWQYTLEAVESTLYQGSYLDGWREIAGVGGGSTAITGGGGGLPAPLPALLPAGLFVGDASGIAVAREILGDVTFTDLGVTAIGDGVIVDADISATAGIVDGKLAIISTPGKVANSATTATHQNVPGAIVARDGGGSFTTQAIAVSELYASNYVSTDLIFTNGDRDLTLQPGAGGFGNLYCDPSGHVHLRPVYDVYLTPGTHAVIVSDGSVVTSGSYASGWAGAGYTLQYNSLYANQSYVEVDRLTVRGTMNVYELLIHQIRATNGSIFVANTGRVKTATFDGAATYAIETEGDHGFAPGDLIRAQRFTSAGGRADVYRSDMIVSLVASATQFSADLQVGTAGPGPGMDFVRLGSAAAADRRASIYLTADDAGAPFMQINDGVASFADWGSAAKIKGRIGNLNGSYGYVSDVYGAAFGEAAGAWIKIDPVNGVRVGHNATTFSQVDAAGNAVFSGTVRIGHVTIDQNGIRIDEAIAYDWAHRAYTFTIPNSQVGLGAFDDGVNVQEVGIHNVYSGGGTKAVSVSLLAQNASYSSGSVAAVSNSAGGSVQLSANNGVLIFDGQLSWGVAGSGLTPIPASSVVARTDTAQTFQASISVPILYAQNLVEVRGYATPVFQTAYLSGAVNQQLTRWISDAAEYDLQFVDDGYTLSRNAIRVTRSQYVLSTIERGDNLSTFNVVSDMNAKTNVRPVSRATQRDLIRALQIYEYDYTGDFGIKVGPGIGPLAQEAKLIFPTSVQTILRARNSNDVDPANWSAREPLLVFNPDTLYMAHVAYTQALDDEIEALKARVTALEVKP